jgi:hypothetical protein
MSHHTRVFGLFALPAILLAGCAPEGQDMGEDEGAEAAEAPPTQRPMEEPGFTDWDVNTDQSMDRQEFAMWSQEEGAFDSWIGDDGSFDREAFLGDVHSALDINDDGQVTESDWTAAVQQLFGDEDTGEWATWDTNSDAQLDADEFATAAEQHGLFTRIDADGDSTLTEEEVRDFTFNLFDANGDERLDMTEWDAGRSTWLGDDLM